MLKHEELYQKIDSLPEEIIQEVEDFVDYLVTKKGAILKKDKEQGSIYGASKGFFEVIGDFNAPLEDFNDYMP